MKYFYYSIYFKDNQSEQINFLYYSIYFKLIKITGLMYSLNELSLRMLFRYIYLTISLFSVDNTKMKRGWDIPFSIIKIK